MIPFIDLTAQKKRIEKEVEAAIGRVLAHGQFILGPEVRELEARLSAYTASPYVVACSDGTDALSLPLRAWGIGPGDAVFVPSFTFCATAEVVSLAGATPVFVDILPDTFNMDATALEQCIAYVQEHTSLTPRAVIVVDLFGQAAEYNALRPIVDRAGLKLIVDAAQSFGATFGGAATTTFGDVATTSFFPAKPLGCYGDGGAIFTQDEALYTTLRSLRAHGMGTHRYEHIHIGYNSRLDTIQAAILLEKLNIFKDEVAARERVAQRYTAALKDIVTTPYVLPSCQSVWAQYTIRHPNREGLKAHLEAEGIPSMIYYPTPIHKQPAYVNDCVIPLPLLETERAVDEVLSLPMHPYLDEETQDRIIRRVASF